MDLERRNEDGQYEGGIFMQGAVLRYQQDNGEDERDHPTITKLSGKCRQDMLVDHSLEGWKEGVCVCVCVCVWFPTLGNLVTMRESVFLKNCDFSMSLF